MGCPLVALDRGSLLSNLIYPLLCRYLKARYLIALAALLLISGPFFRSVLARNEMATDYAYLANFDCIALGCLVAAVPIRLGRFAQIAGWLSLALIVFARRFVFPRPIFASGLDVTLLALAAALAIQHAHPGRVPFYRAPSVVWPQQL